MDKAMACSIPLPTPTVITIPFGISVTSLSPLTRNYNPDLSRTANFCAPHFHAIFLVPSCGRRVGKAEDGEREWTLYRGLRPLIRQAGRESCMKLRLCMNLHCLRPLIRQAGRESSRKTKKNLLGLLSPSPHTAGGSGKIEYLHCNPQHYSSPSPRAASGSGKLFLNLGHQATPHSLRPLVRQAGRESLPQPRPPGDSPRSSSPRAAGGSGKL